MYKPLNIALVMHGWPPQEYGGVGLYVQALAHALHQQGHNVSILVPNPYAQDSTESFPWGTLHLISFPAPQTWAQTWYRTKDEIEARTKGISFDVVHIHHLGHWPLTLPLHVSTQKLFITLHDYAIICARGQLYQPKRGICSGPSAEKCTSCVREQLLYSPSVPKISAILDRVPQIKSRVKKMIGMIPTRNKNRNAMQKRLDTAKMILDHADALFSPSHDLITRYQAYTTTSITHQNLPLLASLQQTPLPDLPYRFIFASSVIPTKGVHLAIKAIRRIPNAELWVAGATFPVDGWPQFEEEIASLIRSTPNAKYFGNIAHGAVFDLLAQSHCLVLPSLWPENSPIIVREALSMGLEVICSFEGGSKELSPLVHTVPNNSEQDLVHVMRTIMSTPKRNPSSLFPSMKKHAHDVYVQYSSSKF